MRIALVGFGRWGRNHARVLAEEGLLAAVVDSDPAQRSHCRQLYPAVAVYEHLSQLPWRDVDGVILASPIDCHLWQALTVFNHGKHCLVEKPLARLPEHVEQIAVAARAANCVLLTGHILDYHPAANELVRMCHAGELGTIREWQSVRTRLVPTQRQTSVIHELLWHDLALVLRIAGRLPQEVSTVGSLEDEGTLILDFGTFQATLSGSQRQPCRQSQVIIRGSDRAVVFDDELSSDSKLSWQRLGGAWYKVAIPSVEPLRAEIRHFVEAARGVSSPISHAEHAIQILRLIEMASYSCAPSSPSKGSPSTKQPLSNPVLELVPAP